MDEAGTTSSARGRFPSRPAEVVPATRRERAVLTFAVLALVVPPWLVGAGEIWAQWTTLALALLAAAVLFAPMFDERAWPPSPGAGILWRRVQGFPVFWLGLAIVAYGIVAACNHWKTYAIDNRNSPFEDLSHIAWLPHSFDTPFDEMNAWHALLILAPVWVVTCAIWAGLETERSWRVLLGAVAANGVLQAVLGMIEHLTGTRKMFWLYDPRPDYSKPEFFGSFIYAGHAAAWMVLALGACIAILDHHLRRRDPRDRPQRRGWPAMVMWLWLAGSLAVLLALGSFVKPDFWILGAGGILALWFWLWQRRIWQAGPKRRAVVYSLPALLFITILLLAMGGTLLWWYEGGMREKLMVNPRDATLPTRFVIARTSLGMIADEPLWGWGPGSYRYVSPDYLRKNPLFLDPAQTDNPILWKRYYAALHAHSDWVQIPAEWGLAGGALFFTILVWWGWQVWRLRRVLPGDAWIVLGAVALVFAGAAADFPLYNPAVLIVIGVLLAAAVKLGEISARPQPALSKVVVACP